MSLWRLLFRLYARRKGALALALALSLLTVAAGVGLLGVSGWFLTGAALAGAGAVFNLFVPSSLVRGLSFIRIASRYGERLAGHAATLRLLADLRASVFRSLVRLTPRQLARYRGGDLVARLTSDVDALDTVFLFVLAPVAVALAGGAILTAVMGAWIPAAALVVAAALLLCCAVAPWWLARAGRRPGAAVQESAAALRAATLDAVEGHADIAALHAGAQARAQFADACEQSARARAAQVRIAARGQWLAQLAAGAAVLAVLWFGLDGLAAGELGGPLLAGLLLATIGIFEVAGPVMRGVSRLGAAVAAAARIGEIAAREPDLRDPAAPRALPPAGELALEDVTFAYPVPDAAPHPVLDGASLRVAPGQRVAIVGASGAGKSTVLQLLLRLEDPQRGAVRYAGCDVRECAQAELHRRVALLSQDAPLLLGTVRTNLLIRAGRRRGAVARAGRGAPGRGGAWPAARPRYVDRRDRCGTVGRPGAPPLPGARVADRRIGHPARRAHRGPGRGHRGRAAGGSGARHAGAHRGARHACPPAAGYGRYGVHAASRPAAPRRAHVTGLSIGARL